MKNIENLAVPTEYAPAKPSPASAPPSATVPAAYRVPLEAKILVGGALILWALTLLSGSPSGAPGDLGFHGLYWSSREIASYLTIGWLKYKDGPWAALVNLTLPFAAQALLRNKLPAKALILSFVLPVTSPEFWSMVQVASATSWRPWTWTGAVLCLLLAGVIARSANRATRSNGQLAVAGD